MSHRIDTSRAWSRRSLAAALVAVLALDPRGANAAGIEPAAADDAAPAAAADMLDVMVDEDVARAAALQERITEDTLRLLRAHKVVLGGEHRVRLTIGVGGEQQAFRVNLGVLRDGKQATPASASFTCECTLEELRARIDQGVVELLPVLTGESPAAAEPSPPPPDVGPPPPPLEPGRRPLGRLGWAGIGVVSVGGAAAVGGIVLLALPRRIRGGADDLEGSGERTDFRPLGFALLGAGLGVVIAGAVMLGVDRHRARRPVTVARSRSGRARALSWIPGIAPGVPHGPGGRAWSVDVSLSSRF